MVISQIIERLRKSSLFKDSFWSVLGNAAGHGLALIVGIFVARYLGKDIYGEYGMIKSTLLNIAIFSTFGLGYTATKFIAEAKNKNNQNIRQIIVGSTNITLVTSTLFSLFLFVFSKQVAVYLEAEHLSFSLRIFAVNIVFNAISTVQIGILAGFKAFKAIAINNAIVGVVTFVLSVVLTYFWGIEGALSALLVASLTKCALNFAVVRKTLHSYPLSEQQSGSIIKTLLLFSLPITLHEGVYSITNWLCILLLIKLSNYGEVGLWSAAQQWSAVILFMPGVLRNVTLSYLSGTDKNSAQHKKVIGSMVLLNFISTLVPCLVVFAFSGLISSFYGEDFVQLPTVLSISVFTTVFGAIQIVYSKEYISINKVWVHFCLSTLFNILTLILAFFSIKINAEKGAYMLVMVYFIVSIIRLLTYYLVLRTINKKA